MYYHLMDERCPPLINVVEVREVGTTPPGEEPVQRRLFAYAPNPGEIQPATTSSSSTVIEQVGTFEIDSCGPASARRIRAPVAALPYRARGEAPAPRSNS